MTCLSKHPALEVWWQDSEVTPEQVSREAFDKETHIPPPMRSVGILIAIEKNCIVLTVAESPHTYYQPMTIPRCAIVAVKFLH